MNLKTEKFYQKQGFQNIFGVDEAGRGPLAGPVAAAAVIIYPPQLHSAKFAKANYDLFQLLKILNDSKQLSPKKREEIFQLAKHNPQLDFAFTLVSEKIIDKINIEQATFLAMKKSIQKLAKKTKLTPDLILIDGNRALPELPYSQKTIIKGDTKIASIALASVIAKVIRDKKMIALAQRYPHYHFEIHKGYPTKLHLKLIKKYGICEIHRKSYKPIKILNF
ncbi:MAG: ribonuclease [Patescibacteria group bacterium]|nr:ribonuclease [Patescibacteria group bacterium]